MDDTFGLAVITPDNMPNYYSEVRTRVNSILTEQYKKACEIIEKNRAAIDALCDALIAKNHLRGPEINDIFKNNITE